MRARGLKNLATGKRRCPHNLSGTRENAALKAAVQRCHNPANQNYPRYGARGIRVCEEWRAPGGVLLFFKHVGPRPSPKHSLDRIENDGHYEPGNVKWSTASEQCKNRRTRLAIGSFSTEELHAELSRRMAESGEITPFNLAE